MAVAEDTNSNFIWCEIGLSWQGNYKGGAVDFEFLALLKWQVGCQVQERKKERERHPCTCDESQERGSKVMCFPCAIDVNQFLHFMHDLCLAPGYQIKISSKCRVWQLQSGAVPCMEAP